MSMVEAMSDCLGAHKSAHAVPVAMYIRLITANMRMPAPDHGEAYYCLSCAEYTIGAVFSPTCAANQASSIAHPLYYLTHDTVRSIVSQGCRVCAHALYKMCQASKHHKMRHGSSALVIPPLEQTEKIKGA